MDFTVQKVVIELTMPDDSIVNFDLEAPNGSAGYHFGFREFPLIEDYRNASKIWMPGVKRYQFFARFGYESHEMDLRYLLASKKINLKFPPKYGSLDDFQQAECLLDNREAVKNYLEGFPFANLTSDVMPSGNLTLNFEGIKPFNKPEVMEFKFLQSQFPDPFIAPNKQIYWMWNRRDLSKYELDLDAGTATLLATANHPETSPTFTASGGGLILDKFGRPYLAFVASNGGPLFRFDPNDLSIEAQFGGSSEFIGFNNNQYLWFWDYLSFTGSNGREGTFGDFKKIVPEDLSVSLISPWTEKQVGHVGRGDVGIISTGNDKGYHAFNRSDFSTISEGFSLFSSTANGVITLQESNLVYMRSFSGNRGELARIGHDGQLIELILMEALGTTWSTGTNGSADAFADGIHFAYYDKNAKKIYKVHGETLDVVWVADFNFSGTGHNVTVFPDDTVIAQHGGVLRYFDENGNTVSTIGISSNQNHGAFQYRGWQTQLWGL